MKTIIEKYLAGNANDGEQAELLEWLRRKGNRSIFNSLKFSWKNGLDKTGFPGGGEETWAKIQSDLLQKSYSGWQKTRKLQQAFRYAAIFFFLTSLAGLAYYFISQPKPTPELFTRVVADNGQIAKALLPDGSTVWLNSGSSVTYSNHFAERDRNVNLEGEAYFQVSKNENLPLVVSCGELQVKVLGTKFNVEAYPGSGKINVVLEQGAVELLKGNAASFQYRLKPGEMAEFDQPGQKLQINNVNTTKFTSWKDGIMHIYNQPIEEVVQRLKTRYNQSFEFENEVKNFHYTFSIKNEPLENILKLMERITPVKAVQQGDVITFKIDRNKLKKIEK